jgi:hypothetical protein
MLAGFVLAPVACAALARATELPVPLIDSRPFRAAVVVLWIAESLPMAMTDSSASR